MIATLIITNRHTGAVSRKSYDRNCAVEHAFMQMDMARARAAGHRVDLVMTNAKEKA
ncbi:hypothetical protein LB518_23005 [Mesorhizobium sp. BR1-1-16]|uniref:hypothetical protein n=1 Tax=Mesorhizobium sp. BR1-1-16 TaxID=2876653 RepID=UPI001CCC9D1D|nr:hypothetical protein [Mesorhizobium sp. BR1-1-16]MBZ9939185.1 hypothetical protein [Mesorhizobium sp. BR1-1-16]